MYPPCIWLKRYELLHELFHAFVCVFIAAAGAFFRLNMYDNNYEKQYYLRFIFRYSGSRRLFIIENDYKSNHLCFHSFL